MNWIKIKDRTPPLNESIVLAINYGRSRRLRFWKKKIIVFGWLQQIRKTANGVEYRYYDHTNDCYWRDSVSHWMQMPQPPN